MGKPRRFVALRGTALVAVAAVVFLPLGGMRAATPADSEPDPVQSGRRADRDEPAQEGERWNDPVWGLSIVPPAGWVRSPAESLNPLSTSPDPVFEIARFQMRLSERSLYAQPVAFTSALLADAGAIPSVGVAREGSTLVGSDPEKWEETKRIAKGFVVRESEDTNDDGLRVFMRTYHATATDRVVVVRVMADDERWSALRGQVSTSLSTVRADPAKANGPRAALPPAPSAPPQPAVEIVDPSLAIRGRILTRAASMLNIPYVWGGTSTRTGMDCSAWLSRVWDVARYTTDSIWQVSFPIAKDELRPGDAVNMTIGRDPRRFGHIRLFEAWANAAHTAMWVYEETPPRSVHRVVVYDDRYQPIRLAGLSNAGLALIVPGTPAPERTSPRPRATVKPTPRPTPKLTARPTARPSVTPTASVAAKTPLPSIKPTPTPIPTATTR